MLRGKMSWIGFSRRNVAGGSSEPRQSRGKVRTTSFFVFAVESRRTRGDEGVIGDGDGLLA